MSIYIPIFMTIILSTLFSHYETCRRTHMLCGVRKRVAREHNIPKTTPIVKEKIKKGKNVFWKRQSLIDKKDNVASSIIMMSSTWEKARQVRTEIYIFRLFSSEDLLPPSQYVSPFSLSSSTSVSTPIPLSVPEISSFSLYLYFLWRIVSCYYIVYICVTGSCVFFEGNCSFCYSFHNNVF